MEIVKKNLRSVLLSKAGGVPLKNVERDYRSLVGERLDWRQFGFGSFEAFLNDLPDVVKVAFKKDEMRAFGVAENMSYINPTARKAQFRETKPMFETHKPMIETHKPMIETHKPMIETRSSDGKMTVYFGNLPLSATVEKIKSLLSEYLVMDIKTVQNHDAISAWVITSDDAAESMCAEFNRQRIGDRMIKVQLAHRQSREQKRPFPATSFSARPSAASVHSDGESSSFGTNSAVEPLISPGDTWSKRNDVGELQRNVADEHFQQQGSRPDAYNSDSVFPNEVALNSGYARSSSLLSGAKDGSAGVAELAQLRNGADCGQGDSNFLRDDGGDAPMLVEGRDWAEFDNGTSAEYFNSQRGYSDQSRDEPPPLLTKDGFEKLQQDDDVSSSSSYRRNVYEKYGPYDGETFNLYVKNIPLGTTLAELSDLFKNAVRIVELSKQCCFAVFSTFQEVEEASRRSWMIRGSPIYVDVATKYKHLAHARNDGHDDQLLDLSAGFENLTCTVGSNNERTVQLRGEKNPTENKSNNTRTQATGNSNVRENFQQSALPMADMPPLVSRAERTNSQANVLPTANNVVKPNNVPTNNVVPQNNVVPPNNVPPLLSDEELAKLRANQSQPPSQKPQQLARQRNPEMADQDLPASTWNDASSRPQWNASESRKTHLAAARKTVLPQQFQSFSDFDEDHGSLNSAPLKRMRDESSSQQHYPKSTEDLPSAKRGNSSDYFQDCDREEGVMPVLTQRDNRNSSAKLFEPLSGVGESLGLGNRGCSAPRSSRLLSAAAASSQLAPASVSPLKPIPDEMRLKELQRMLMDTFPGDTLPTSYMLPEVINVIIICAVPGFENSFFWGQVASEPYQSELQKMYDLLPRMEELSSSLTVASAALRRGAAKYGEDWCRVWIKVRGETTSTVFFIDFGNFETVSNTNIYELPEEFWKVRPTALPFRVLDSEKLDISEYINQRVSAKVNKKCQRGCIFEIYDLQAQS